MYEEFLRTFSSSQWKRIGIQRRAGVAVPLFSVYSADSIGIGDILDLKYLVDWCQATGMSIIQLLPMNDIGFNFMPYDASSTFALEPMYLSLSNLKDVDEVPFLKDLNDLKKNFPTGVPRVNYKIKSEKLSLLWKIFQAQAFERNHSFENFVKQHSFWLKDYCLYKVLKELHQEKPWEEWPIEYKNREGRSLNVLNEKYRMNILFHEWLQWQLYEQFVGIKKYAAEKKIFLMGDLPFLVSRDSADVWAHQNYFRLDEAAGAPSDMLFSKGQRWGMPPYHWEHIARNHYDYTIEKLRYAENFYDLYRIDHSVGIFRLWTIPLSEPLELGGLHGFFVPKDEHCWEAHGLDLLTVMIKNSQMLACAEDLGTVPPCSYKVLSEFGIPGIDVQRWMRDWDKSFDFKDPSGYRKNSVSTIATHDLSGLGAWWKVEAGTVDEELFKRKCQEKNISFESVSRRLFDFDHSNHGRLRWKKDVLNTGVLLDRLGLSESSCKDLLDLYKGSYDEKNKFLNFLGFKDVAEDEFTPLFVKRVLEKVNSSASIFSIQLLHDWLTLDDLFDFDPWELRINFPGTMSGKNWSMVLPLSLEDLLALPVNEVIKTINGQALRI
jgi:4-alpha-glucanotransferase